MAVVVILDHVVSIRFALLASLVAGALVVSTSTVDAGKKKKRRKGIPVLTDEGLPNVQAKAAIVIDKKTGGIFYEKNPDEVRYIASTGKIFVAMVVRNKGIDLEALTEMTDVDKSYAKGGARTRLHLGHQFRNIDLLKAMLIASDNRAPTALGRAVGLSPDELIAEMNSLADELGLENTEFTDPSGLRGNQSTAREMALALEVAMSDEVLAEIMGTKDATVKSVHKKPKKIDYHNTNRSLHDERYDVAGGKTGFTSKAGYCLVTEATIAGHDVLIAVYGTKGKLTRFADVSRIAQWMEGAETLVTTPPPSRGIPPATVGATAAGYGSL